MAKSPKIEMVRRIGDGTVYAGNVSLNIPRMTIVSDSGASNTENKVERVERLSADSFRSLGEAAGWAFVGALLGTAPLLLFMFTLPATATQEELEGIRYISKGLNSLGYLGVGIGALYGFRRQINAWYRVKTGELSLAVNVTSLDDAEALDRFIALQDL